MAENSFVNLTEFQTVQLEWFADLLESIEYSKDDFDTKFLLLILNIESLLPMSNIFEYVLKTDLSKEKKLTLEEERKVLYEGIEELNNKHLEEVRIYNEKIEELNNRHNEEVNRFSEELTQNYQNIEKIDNELSEIQNNIEDSEWKVEVDSNEEVVFNEIKEKLVLQKRLNYGNI